MTGDPTALTRITDDIYQARLPLPFALRSVNVYLLRGAHGWTLVDTGIHTPEAVATWHGILAELGLRVTDFEQIVLTHVHPDHFGLAGWWQAQAAAAGHTLPVLLSPRELTQVGLVWRNPAASHEFAGWLQQAGMTAAMAHSVNIRMDDTHSMTLPHPDAAALTTILPGATLRLGRREFRAILAPGHSDGQLLFYDESDALLLCGDHVLMKITPNIGLWAGSDPDPLHAFLESLAELRALPVRLALPGHKTPVLDWRGRIDELVQHHHDRLHRVEAALAQGAATPYEISRYLFDSARFTPHEWRFALAETLAHVEYLRRRGRAQTVAEAPVRRFARA
ncbi:MAG: MBL fold metallo-hydrolase [Anaerolineae bacterium]|jgi:glyoxylase-like metal-dependent hydrolase (beta-lactamase superfamily II)|nr:MBL fold metallo-hydrolase [Anaerolineae bacterium]